MTLFFTNFTPKSRQKPASPQRTPRPQPSTQTLPYPTHQTVTITAQIPYHGPPPGSTTYLPASPPPQPAQQRIGYGYHSPPPAPTPFYQQMSNPSVRFNTPPSYPSQPSAVISTQFLPGYPHPHYPVSPPHSPPQQQRLPVPPYPQDQPQPKSKKPSKKKSCALLDTTAKLASVSMSNLNNTIDKHRNEFNNMVDDKTTECLTQGAALFDVMSNKLDAAITRIDGEDLNENDVDSAMGDVVVYSATVPPTTSNRSLIPATNIAIPRSNKKASAPATTYFAKSWQYSNSRLPAYLPPLKVYIPTWPLLCLAAQYSERVYNRPTNAAEAEVHVNANWMRGTKAMVVKSVPIDEVNTVVFAIRGSQTFMDWAVNFREAPCSPVGFLDDPGNHCHAGFLHVARQMIRPVADRLRALLSENPSRSNCSLLITGHSAGGAVAALLYAHMMSSNVTSDLSYLTSFFKRVHCVTFGAPPVSLLPLVKPSSSTLGGLVGAGRERRKSLFFAFVNEGDPVVRADRETVKSLLKLYISPAPAKNATERWNIPSGTLSVAGRVVLLRTKPPSSSSSGRGKDKKVRGPGNGPVEAVTIDDEMLRDVVYGDPVMHMMKVYVRRIEELATRAVTAQGS